MSYAIKASTNNPSTTFVLNGLEYPRGIYIIDYGSYLDNSGVPESVDIGISNKHTGATLVPAVPYYRYTDGTNAFTSLSGLVSHLVNLIT